MNGKCGILKQTADGGELDHHCPGLSRWRSLEKPGTFTFNDSSVMTRSLEEMLFQTVSKGDTLTGCCYGVVQAGRSQSPKLSEG
jgi:hypothetical protein